MRDIIKIVFFEYYLEETYTMEKKMELLEEENNRLKKEIENLREACKVQEQTISKLWNAYIQLEEKTNK